MFYGEHGIVLQAMQENRSSSHTKGEVSWFLATFIGNLGYILMKRPGWPVKIHVCSAMSGILSSCEGHHGILLGQGSTIGNPIQKRQRPSIPFQLPQGNWDSYQFSRVFTYRLILKH